jgi:hypothetical protein
MNLFNSRDYAIAQSGVCDAARDFVNGKRGLDDLTTAILVLDVVEGKRSWNALTGEERLAVTSSLGRII